MGFNGSHEMADHVPQDNVVQGGDVFNVLINAKGKDIERSAGIFSDNTLYHPAFPGRYYLYAVRPNHGY